MHVEGLHGRQARLAKMVVYEHNKPGQQKCIMRRSYYATAGYSFNCFRHAVSVSGRKCGQLFKYLF